MVLLTNIHTVHLLVSLEKCRKVWKGQVSDFFFCLILSRKYVQHFIVVNPWKRRIRSESTSKRILERRRTQTSSSFVKIWLVCIREFLSQFLIFFGIYIQPSMTRFKVFPYKKYRKSLYCRGYPVTCITFLRGLLVAWNPRKNC